MKFTKRQLSFFFAFVLVVGLFVGAKKLLADTGSNANGYMWSSNIGWIKLNDCENVADDSTCTTASSYGVTILPVAPGTVSGYAWSANIGWITFNNTGCPTTGCTPGARGVWNPDGSATIKGWARACSVYADGCSGTLKDAAYLGTWDGYIALDSASAGGAGGPWGLTIGTDKKITGFAWGSEVIGWIKGITSSIYLGGPTAQIAANPAAIKKGESSTLTVTATNIDGAGSCVIANIAGLTMANNGSGTWTGTVSVSPIVTTTYSVTCTKGTQTAKASTAVTATFFAVPDCATTGNCTTNPNGPGSGGQTSTGGYCALDYPQFAWNTNADACSITQQGVGGKTINVGPSSQARGGTLAADGLYYYTANFPTTGTGGTYVLQCTGATSGPISIPITVPNCQKDFLITASPNSQTFVASADGKTSTATFTVSIVPQFGFTAPVALTVASWPTLIPASKSATFDTPTLSYSGSSYGTAQLTITVNTEDLKASTSYDNIVIQGVGGTFTRVAKVKIDSVVKSKPIFTEF